MARNVNPPKVADAVETPMAGEWAKIKRDVDRGYRLFCERRGINPEQFFAQGNNNVFRRRKGRPTKAEQQDKEDAKECDSEGPQAEY